jgi:c(7)-type cytochrome triheme protein
MVGRTIPATLAGALLLGLLAGAPPGRAATDPSKRQEIELRLPPDLVFDRITDSPGKVVFSHTSHAAFADNKCLTCHPRPFSILHASLEAKHDEMNAGRSCGICHDGRRAFATSDGSSCESCHAGQAAAPSPVPVASLAGPAAAPATGSPARRPAPRDVAFKTTPGSPGQVTFRHATHGRTEGGCARCHPRPFARKAGATVLVKEAMLKGETCGACHDGKQAFAVDDVDACGRCHAAGGAGR